MRKQKIYLETTIFNYYFDTDRDAHLATVQLFNEIKEGKFEAYTSVYVTKELENAPEPKRNDMLTLIKKYGITVIEPSDEIERLAECYVREGIVPQKYIFDALHIATTTVNNLDSILSLNFQHINRAKTKQWITPVNMREGYKGIMIFSPMEVINEENK